MEEDKTGEGGSYAPSSRTSMTARVGLAVPASAAAAAASCSARISFDRDVAESRWRDPIVVIFSFSSGADAWLEGEDLEESKR